MDIQILDIIVKINLEIETFKRIDSKAKDLLKLNKSLFNRLGKSKKIELSIISLINRLSKTNEIDMYLKLVEILIKKRSENQSIFEDVTFPFMLDLSDNYKKRVVTLLME